jgi:hypothetical protein
MATSNDATLAVHPCWGSWQSLRVVIEHGEEWVYCKVCGQQWELHDADAEMITVGDETCDDEVSQ